MHFVIDFMITPSSNETEVEKYLWNSKKREIVGVHFRNLKSSTSTPYKFSYILMHLEEGNSYTDLSIMAQLILNLNFIQYTNPATSLTIEKIKETLQQVSS